MQGTDLLAARLVLVTGKGGVGKSTVAGALAVAGARSGRRTCLIEVEGRQALADLLGTAPWEFGERELLPGLFGLSIDADSSLAEYLHHFYGAQRLSRLVVGSSAVNFATAAAPGVRDVLLLGKVKEVERRGVDRGHPAYDLVIVDAPPTGRIVNFLRAPEATTELVGVGPVRSQAQSIVDLLLDGSRTRLQLVAAYEELSVTETVESATALAELGLALNPVVVNRVLEPCFDTGARKALSSGLSVQQLRAVLVGAGIKATAAAASELRELGHQHLQRVALQQQLRERLESGLRAEVPTAAVLDVRELPAVSSETFGLTEIQRLADEILEPAGT
ncbi:MAG TPA: ArsA-related P-loop ATPase [Egibacteraceae bacterium]|nr:ArsA-related P-loop ATPase [Egibacteraceae bacterium]